MKRIFFILLILQCSAFCAANSDTTVVRDLSYDWFFYQDQGYLPLVDKSAYIGKTIHFDINTHNYEGTSLLINSKQKVSVFINNQLAARLKDTAIWNIDSLNKIFSENMHFAVYSKTLNPYNLSTEVVRIDPSTSNPLGENTVLIKQRKDISLFNTFIIVALIILASFLAALYNYYPRALSDFFKINRAVALREIDENILKSRPLNQVNLLFYFFLCLLIALTLMLFVNYSNTYFETKIFYPEGFWNGIWKWIKISCIVFIWIIGKYLLINTLTSLFKLNFFQSSHYFNYIRITLLIFSSFLILLTLSYFAFDIISTSYYTFIFDVLLFCLVVRVLILFFRLLNTGSYKSLHLFSYLCGTEVIPLVVLLYLGLNQPF